MLAHITILNHALKLVIPSIKLLLQHLSSEYVLQVKFRLVYKGEKNICSMHFILFPVQNISYKRIGPSVIKNVMLTDWYSPWTEPAAKYDSLNLHSIMIDWT